MSSRTRTGFTADSASLSSADGAHSSPAAAAAALPLLQPLGTGTVLSANSAAGNTSPASSKESTGVVPVSNYPVAVDTFSVHADNGTEIARASHFNALSAALEAVQAHSLRTTRTGPYDLSTRLQAGVRILFL